MHRAQLAFFVENEQPLFTHWTVSYLFYFKSVMESQDLILVSRLIFANSQSQRLQLSVSSLLSEALNTLMIWQYKSFCKITCFYLQVRKKQNIK